MAWRALGLASDAEVSLFPDPANDAVTLRLTLPAADEVSVVLRDLNGRSVKVLTPRAQAGAGTTELSFELTDVPDEVYLVEIKGGQRTFRVQRLIIAK